jgi:SHS2 domain-containing protein
VTPLPAPQPAAAWEHFEHDADLGVRGYGMTAAEAFEQAALALSAAITDPAAIRPAETVRVECRDEDLELLFADWLNAIIYESATRNLLFGRFDVELHDGLLTGILHGEPVDRERHQPVVEPKGATYTELRVAQQPDGRWLAQCVIDV